MTVTRFHFIKAVKIHQVVSKIFFCSIHLLNTASGSGTNITKSIFSGLEGGGGGVHKMAIFPYFM